MTETLISSSVLILTVILLRTAFKGRISSRARYALWLIAAVRLLMRFELAESSVSVMNLFSGIEISVASEAPEISQTPPITANIPDTAAVPADTASGNEPVNVGNTDSENDNTANIQRETLTDERTYTEEADSSPAQAMPYTKAQEMQEGSEIPAVQNVKGLSAAEILRLVWLIGTAVMLMWFIIVNVVFHAELKRDRSPLEYSSPLKIYVCKGLTSPCIFGFLKPSVYVTPEAAREKRMLDMVVAHELGHYYHGDIFWTVLRYFLLSVYWFDPFVWLAAVLSKRDCECACDEAVIRRFGSERRFEYGKAIVDMIPEKGKSLFGVASASMSSGGRVLRERIKFISKNPKNLTAAVICTVLVTVFAAGCTFTSAVSPEPVSYGEAFPDETTTAAEDIHEPKDTVSDLKGKDDLYINVTDSDGREKTLFYMLPPAPGGEAFVYMDEISDDPYARIGYIPEESLDAPAKAASGYYGLQMAEFIEASRFSAADISRVNNVSGLEEDFADAPNVISGTFGKNRCAYYADNGTSRLVFEDGNANIYTAVFEGADSGSETAAKILGSIHMKKAEPAAPYVPAVPLSKTPGIYGDENYELTKTDWYYYNYFRANAPAMLVTGFRVTDKSREYETDFNCYIEKQEPDGKWYRVIPTGELIQANSGYHHFYTDEETGRIPVCLDLSCYPLLPEGKYRLVKPFREAGASSDEYAALWDFNMSENVTPRNELLCTAECTDTVVSANASTITCKVSANKILFLMSENTDIERETAAGWQSVRKTSIHTNTAHASFPLASSGTYEIDASDFDISKSGNYRVRFSYCSCDEQSVDAHDNGYDTAYAYFKVN